VRIRLLAFASAADALGAGERELDLPAGTTVGALRAHLAAAHPGLVPLLPRLAVAVEGEVARDETLLADGQEVALLPPVSGGAPSPEGSPLARLTEEPLDAEGVAALVAGADCGAVVLFVGTVRAAHRGSAVARLTY
jgi:molybdopterin synthase catalytic subunit